MFASPPGFATGQHMSLTDVEAHDDELESQSSGVETIRTGMLILCCSGCSRSVKVFGRVSRVLRACGQVLLEVPVTHRDVAHES